MPHRFLKNHLNIIILDLQTNANISKTEQRFIMRRERVCKICKARRIRHLYIFIRYVQIDNFEKCILLSFLRHIVWNFKSITT